MVNTPVLFQGRSLFLYYTNLENILLRKNQKARAENRTSITV